MTRSVTAHAAGDAAGRKLCLALVERLGRWIPGVIRNETKRCCTLGAPEGNNFAYIYHRKTIPSLEIWFLSQGTVPQGEFGSLVIRPRDETARSGGRQGWQATYKSRFNLEKEEQLIDAVALLVEQSYPLSGRKGRRRRPPHAVAEELHERQFVEGATTRVEVNRYERDARCRETCIAHHGSRCVICGFDFGAFYGPDAQGYIHVHHLVPVSQLGTGHRVDPVRDLRPVCANCHAFVHRRDPPFTIDEARDVVRRFGRWLGQA